MQLEELLRDIHFSLSCICIESNQNESALLHYCKLNEMMGGRVGERSNESDPRLAVSWNLLGNAAMYNGMLEEAQRCVEEYPRTGHMLSKLTPADSPSFHLKLGLAYWRTGRLVESKRTLEEGFQSLTLAHGGPVYST